jgi:hypothetical protein
LIEQRSQFDDRTDGPGRALSSRKQVTGIDLSRRDGTLKGAKRVIDNGLSRPSRAKESPGLAPGAVGGRIDLELMPARGAKDVRALLADQGVIELVLGLTSTAGYEHPIVLRLRGQHGRVIGKRSSADVALKPSGRHLPRENRR